MPYKVVEDTAKASIVYYYTDPTGADDNVLVRLGLGLGLGLVLGLGFRVFELAVWCSGNALVLINAVALHQARLVLGRVTAFG